MEANTPDTNPTEQERFYVGLDGSFDWKQPSQKLKGDKDCTDMTPKVFETFMVNVYRKKWQPSTWPAKTDEERWRDNHEDF